MLDIFIEKWSALKREDLKEMVIVQKETTWTLKQKEGKLSFLQKSNENVHGNDIVDGTCWRLVYPSLEGSKSMEVLTTLRQYVEALRYTLPQEMTMSLECETSTKTRIQKTIISIESKIGRSIPQHLQLQCQCLPNDIVFEEMIHNGIRVQGWSVIYETDEKPKCSSTLIMPVQLLRWVNGLPLMIRSDLYHCSILQGIAKVSEIWKECGWECTTTDMTTWDVPFTLHSDKKIQERSTPHMMLVVHVECKSSNLEFQSLSRSSIVNEQVEDMVARVIKRMVPRWQKGHPSLFGSVKVQRQAAMLNDIVPQLAQTFEDILCEMSLEFYAEMGERFEIKYDRPGAITRAIASQLTRTLS